VSLYFITQTVIAVALIPLALAFKFVSLTATAAQNQPYRSVYQSYLSGAAMQHMYLKSPTFQSGNEIPKQFTCEGQDLSPALQWGDAPAKTQSFALIADDPDAPSGTFVHWVLFDLPTNMTELPQGVPKSEHLGSGGTHGTNDFGKIGYGGPCPPAGKTHRYFFKLYALDTTLALKPGAKKQDVERAMKGHILDQTELIGKYQRKGRAAA